VTREAYDSENPVSDALLLSRIRDGDVEAEGELWERYQPRIRFFILRKVFGNMETAADLEQEVFLALQKAARTGRLSNPGTIGSYLYKTSLNQVLRWKERDKRSVPIAHPDFPCTEENPETLHLDSETLSQLQDTVDRLHLIDRRVIILRYAEEWSYRQIGTTLGISEDNARQRACRAIARLRRDIHDYQN